MRLIISLLFCLLICFGMCFAFADIIIPENTENTSNVETTQSGEGTVSLFTDREDDELGTLRKERVKVPEKEENFNIKDETAESYGNPLLNIFIALIVLMLIILTIALTAKKTLG